VSDDQGFGGPGNPLGVNVFRYFKVINKPAVPSQSPLRVARDASGNPRTLPVAGNAWNLPVGYVSAAFNKVVSVAALGRYSAQLIPRSGGSDDTAFDAADVPVNARVAFNPNTDQLIIVPSQPVGPDTYQIALSGMNGAQRDGTPNPSDPLTDPGGLPVYASFAVSPAGAPHVAVGATREARPGIQTPVVLRDAAAAIPFSPAGPAWPRRSPAAPARPRAVTAAPALRCRPASWTYGRSLSRSVAEPERIACPFSQAVRSLTRWRIGPPRGPPAPDGLYIWGHPSEATANRIWGLPVVFTTYCPQSHGIVAEFLQHTELI
jgi:hypothetical protein